MPQPGLASGDADGSTPLVSIPESELSHSQLGPEVRKSVKLGEWTPRAPAMTRHLVSVRALAFQLGADFVQLHEMPLQLVEEEINHRRGKQRKRLRDQEPADNGDAQRLAQF